MEPCNFLTKRALVSQPSTIVVAKDPNISHYLNLSIYLPTSILAIIGMMHTQRDCPSQMNENLLISVTKLTRYRWLICFC